MKELFLRKRGIENMSIFRKKAIDDMAAETFEPVGDSTEKRQVSNYAKVFMKVREWFRDIVPAVVCAYVLFGIILNVTVVSGESMYPTLEDGALVFLQRIGYSPERGDIVVLTVPKYDTALIKRIIAVEGDTIDIDFSTGTVRLNGMVLQENYIAEPTYRNEGVDFPLTVERGYVFVMGDNRNDSTDSRSPIVGQVDVDNIIGGYLFSIPVGK